MKKLLLTGLLAIGFFANAQLNLNWAKSMGGFGSANNISYATSIDASGNAFTTGTYTGTVDFDPGLGVFNLTSNSGSNDIFITKFNSAGTFVWAKSIGGPGLDRARSITNDASGNVISVGEYAGTVDFDPGVGTFNLVGIGLTDIYISKLDASGNFVFAKTVGGASVYNSGISVVLDGSSNIYYTGWFAGTADFDTGVGVFNLVAAGSMDCFVSKLNSAGGFVWAKNMGGSGGSDYGYSIALDASGNVYTTGWFNVLTDFDPGPGTFNLTPAGVDDIFISKLNSAGNFVWAKQIGGVSYEFGCAVAIDATGNVITTGGFQGTVDFDPGIGVFNLASGGGNNIYVSKLDASGNFVWAKSMNGTGTTDAGRAIVVDASNNIYLTGWFSGATDFDPGVGVYNMSPIGSNDIFLSKLDPSGNFVFASRFGDVSDDQGKSIVLDASGVIYTTGYYGGTIDFDPSVNVFNITAQGQDMYVLKICQTPLQPASISGTTAICSGASALYSISPAAGAISYTWSLPAGWSGSSNTISVNVTAGNASGNITVTANNACGASMGQTLNITVNPTPTISVNSGSICSGNSFTMAPSGANTYSFQGGNAVVIPTANASYTVIGTSTAGCVSISSATSNVGVNTTPTINVNSGCIGLGNSFTIVPSGANTYTFQGGNAVVSPTTNTSYTVVGTSTAGCVSLGFATAFVTVNAGALPTITVNSGTICSGQSFTMVPSGAFTYTFQGGSAVVSPTSNTSYTVIGTATTGCTSYSFATSFITINASPIISVTGSGSICVGGSATLTASGASSYSWNAISSNSSILVSPTTTTTYTASGISIVNGCSGSNVVILLVSPCIGIAENNLVFYKLSIYPNPNNGSFIIKSDIEMDLKITNELGQLIKSISLNENNKYQISVNDLANGIYFISDNNGKVSVKEKVIVIK